MARDLFSLGVRHVHLGWPAMMWTFLQYLSRVARAVKVGGASWKIAGKCGSHQQHKCGKRIEKFNDQLQLCIGRRGVVVVISR